MGANARDVSVNGKGGVVEGVAKGVASTSLSLEGVLQQSFSQDQSGLIKLIEVCSGLGLFALSINSVCVFVMA